MSRVYVYVLVAKFPQVKTGCIKIDRVNYIGTITRFCRNIKSVTTVNL